MLSDAAVERWSRQILLPEVGGRGQERLCAAHAAIVGDGPAAELAARLVARAGVGLASAAGADVLIDLGNDPWSLDGVAAVVGRLRAARIVVATLVGRPCAACVAPALLGESAVADSGPLAAPAAAALGALAAGEALRVVLMPAAAGRVQSVDLATGSCAGAILARTLGCGRCAERS